MNKIKNFLKHPLFAGSLVMVGGNMTANVVNYVYHLIMGRVLGPVNYGILASLYSIIYLISVVPTSASVAIVKFISSAKDETEAYSIYKSIQKIVFYIAISASVLLLICAPLVGKFLNIVNIGPIFLVAAILFLSLITLVNQATSQGILKFIGSVAPNLISALIKLAVGVGLVLIGWSVFGAMVGVVIGATLAYFYSGWFIKKYLKVTKIRAFNLGPFLKYSLPVLIQAFAFTSLFTTDVLLVKHFLPAFDAGIYAALSTLGKIIFFACQPITATMFPIVAGRKAKGQGYLKVFLLSFVVIFLVSAGIVMFYWLFPNLAIGVLYGKAYLSAKAELVWMGLFILVYTLSYLLVNFSLSLGKTKVIVFPLITALLQVGLLWLFHGSLMQVIQISLTITFVQFVLMAGYLIYNQRKETNAGN